MKKLIIRILGLFTLPLLALACFPQEPKEPTLAAAIAFAEELAKSPNLAKVGEQCVVDIRSDNLMHCFELVSKESVRILEASDRAELMTLKQILEDLMFLKSSNDYHKAGISQ